MASSYLSTFTFGLTDYTGFLIHGQIRLQTLNILVKCFSSGARDFANRMRVIVFKIFYYINISRFPKFIDLHTEVSCLALVLSFNTVNSASCSRIRKEMIASVIGNAK